MAAIAEGMSGSISFDTALNKEANLVSINGIKKFFRWNDNACPGPSITSLYTFIDAKFDENPNLERVVLLGHSYGGLLVAAFTDKWDKEIPLEAHSIMLLFKCSIKRNGCCLIRFGLSNPS